MKTKLLAIIAVCLILIVGFFVNNKIQADKAVQHENEFKSNFFKH